MKLCALDNQITCVVVFVCVGVIASVAIYFGFGYILSLISFFWAVYVFKSYIKMRKSESEKLKGVDPIDQKPGAD